ncbi:MAG TPA: amidohydrolase [Pseudogracilibacillus sp.]|nr:amidohydrolase [Pseudogracilibacillus sp.]
MLAAIYEDIDQHFAEMVEIRRYLHQHPELSFKEFNTAQYISDFYKKIGIPVESKVGGNGVIATLKGKLPGKTIALRADFDALPIQDAKDVPYKSKVDGVMHACGHDAHTASLLVLAKIMQKHVDKLEGSIVFLHQHAEELPPGGAKSIVQSGMLSEVDAVFGNHFWSTLPVGTIGTKEDVFMAGADRFTITIRGKGGHGAYPEETKDAVVIGAELITKLQTIISRKVSPIDTGVLTIGQFQAGTAFNIIADEAKLQGTIRYLKPEVKETMKAELFRIIHGVCEMNDADCDIDYQDGYPPLVNHPNETEIIFEVAKEIEDVTNVLHSPVQLAAEDFAYYTEYTKGAFFFTGAHKVGHDHPHHHPMFDIDERAMPIAAKTLIGAYFACQAQGKEE